MARDLILALDPWYGRKDITNMQGKTFTDERLKGTDARVLRDAEGTPVIAYAFVNKKTLIIARNDAILVALIEKIVSDEVLVLP